MTSKEPPVAIVTGAALGIGRAIAHRLARQGARIIAVDNNEPAGLATAGELHAEGLEVKFVQADVGIVEDVRKIVSFTADTYRRLDWIVNNAGVSWFKAIEEIEVAEFDRIININLRSAFVLTKFALPLLRNSVEAAIVNISSTRAFMSEPNNEAYATAKAGLLGLTHALANSLGPKVRINAICPGWINVSQPPEAFKPRDHAQHPAGRVGLPEDIAGMAAFLLSPAASFITGQAFIVDGGMTKKMIYEE
ncbi:SDR family NAD(P)-dependent oxidoreductase [Sporomusa aerivorans]|uniref:SDR family NAD(P)-dependent oxidoreductase n=1 Tax=Sporomusa aerivorans TaxID=204936 RepID=UPI00352A84E6